MHPKLNYANVMSTLCFFLLLGGSAYAAGHLGKNAVKSKNIAANAVKSRNIAKNAVKPMKIASNAVISAKIKKEAVTADKLKAATLTRTQLAGGTLAGLHVADFQSSSVPGLTTDTGLSGISVPLTGTASFTPVAGKSYELLVEMKGNPIDVDGPGPDNCRAGVVVFATGGTTAEAFISANANNPPPFNYHAAVGEAVPLGLLSPGQVQTLTVLAYGDEACGAATSASMRAVVVEFG